MKKGMALLLAGITAVFLTSCSAEKGALNQDTEAPKISSETESANAQEKTPWLEDYDTFWTIVEENYVLYAAAERITGNDFMMLKKKYRPQAAKAENADELFTILDACVQAFDVTGHFRLLTDDKYRSLTALYGSLASEPPYAFLYNRLNNPASIRCYHFDPAQKSEENAESGNAQAGNQRTENISFQEYPDYNAAYVSIAQMTNSSDNNDGQVLNEWFQTIEDKGCQHCIVDIRGNQGGDSGYWNNYIVKPNLKSRCAVINYALIKGSECIKYWQTAGAVLHPISTMPLKDLPKLEQEDLNGITHYITISREWNAPDKPLFSGRFWLLTDEAVYSSSEMFAAFCKDTGFATLVGSPTGGDGIGYDPLVFALPNSGICFRFSAVEGLNTDGSCNEEYGTQPDIALKNGEDALEICLDAIGQAN